MAGFLRWQASGTTIDPITTTINFASLSATKDGDTTTLTQTGAETVTTQTATVKVITPILDAIAAGALSIGPTTATSITLGANTNLAANKNLACLAGTTAVDLSLGTGTFKTTTGAHDINGTATLAANKNILCAAGTTALDFSLGTGAFKTTTGAVSINGTATIAANKNLDCAAGTTAVDLSLGTGTFKPPTGIFTFQGKVAATATGFSIADPGNGGAIPVTTSGVCNLTSGGAETRTLAIPTFVGQVIALACDVDGGDNVITVASAFNQAANTTITLNDAGDFVLLEGVHIGGTRRWRLVVNDGATLG